MREVVFPRIGGTELEKDTAHADAYDRADLEQFQAGYVVEAAWYTRELAVVSKAQSIIGRACSNDDKAYDGERGKNYG